MLDRSRGRALENVSERFQLNHLSGLFGFHLGLNQVQGMIVGNRDNRYEFPSFVSGFVQDDHQFGRIEMAGKYSVFPLLHDNQS